MILTHTKKDLDHTDIDQGFSALLTFCGLVAKSCPTLVTPWAEEPGRLRPWDSPGKNTREGCHFLLKGMFLTQESNLGLLNCRHILYHLSYEGSPADIWGLDNSLLWGWSSALQDV